MGNLMGSVGLDWIGSGWVQIFPLVKGWIGLGQSADGLGWIGSHKMDPWTTLMGPRTRPHNPHQRQKLLWKQCAS